MSLLDAIVVVAVGLAAGAVNAVVGSGTLLTFPTLLALGYPPVVANVSNTIGLVPGSVAGAVGYRAELAGQRTRLVRLGAASLAGGLVGAVLLLVLPDGAFRAAVPVLIALGLVLVLAQPVVSRRLARRPGGVRPQARWVWPAVLGIGVYGGYFGAAQGVLLLAVLGSGVPDGLQRLNGTKNVLAALTNAVAGVLFALVADVDWTVVALLAGGSVVGGRLGAGVGRRLPPVALRGVIVAVGVVALVAQLLRG